MPAKTAEKKLLLPTIAILLALSLLAIIPILHHEAPVFISLGYDCRGSLPLSSGFAAFSYGEVAVYSPKGKLVLDEKLAVSPELCTSNGDIFAAVSSGCVRLYSSKGFLGEIPESGEILSLAATGNYIVASRLCADYACCVTVYQGLTPVFERFIAAGACISAAEAGGTLFLALDCGDSSQLLLLDSKGSEIARLEFPDKIETLHRLDNAVCAEFSDLLRFIGTGGEVQGEYDETFSSVRAFDGVLCALVPGGAVALNAHGEPVGMTETSGNVPRSFGEGKYPALILGEEVTVFNKKMEYKYTIKNKYVPQNVMTYRDGAVLVWPCAAEIHRK
ncbi:MAG: hypothetical protein AB7D36_00410 [Oscillospiraceae bacterium]